MQWTASGIIPEAKSASRYIPRNDKPYPPKFGQTSPTKADTFSLTYISFDSTFGAYGGWILLINQ